MRKSAFLAVALLVAVPGNAQDRQRNRNSSRNYRRDDQFQRLMDSNQSIVPGLFGGLSRQLCANHRGSGDQMEMSHCYGVVTDQYGRATGRNNYAAGSQGYGYHALANQNNVNGWGAGNLLVGVGNLALNIANTRKLNDIRRATQAPPVQSFPEPVTPDAPPTARSPIRVLVNNSGQCLQINGQRVEDRGNVVLRAGDEVSVAHLPGSTCSPVATKLGDGVVGLTCR